MITFKLLLLMLSPMALDEIPASSLEERLESLTNVIASRQLTYDSLQQEYASLKALLTSESLRGLHTEVADLGVKREDLTSQISELSEQIKERRSVLEKANEKLGGMDLYADIKKKEEFEASKGYFEKRYSDMSVHTLDSISKISGNYSDIPGFDDYQARLQNAINNKGVYEESLTVLASPFNMESVKTVRRKLFPLLDAKVDQPERGIYQLTPEQFSELDSLDIRLSRFRGGVRVAQKIIADLNADEEIVKLREDGHDSDKSILIEKIEKVLYPATGSKESGDFLKYIVPNPYLSDWLKRYNDELKKNPFSSPEALEMEIMELNTE